MSNHRSDPVACLISIAFKGCQDAGSVVAAEAILHAPAVVAAEVLVGPVLALVPPAVFNSLEVARFLKLKNY